MAAALKQLSSRNLRIWFSPPNFPFAVEQADDPHTSARACSDILGWEIDAGSVSRHNETSNAPLMLGIPPCLRKALDLPFSNARAAGAAETIRRANPQRKRNFLRARLYKSVYKFVAKRQAGTRSDVHSGLCGPAAASAGTATSSASPIIS